MKDALVDMDGVLVDFVRGAFRHFGKDIDYRDIRWNLEGMFGFQDNPADFWDQLGYDFWANLPWTPGGRELLDGILERVSIDHILICTSPCRTKGSIEGKIDWLRKHVPDLQRNFMITPKKRFAAGPNRILIDDHDANITEFLDAGGLIVQVPQPWNRLSYATTPQGNFDPQYVLRDFANVLEM